MDLANRLEFHYYLEGDSHKMDAFIRNKVEAEILNISKEILSAYDFDIGIISEPPKEGGFAEFWTFISHNQAALGLLLGGGGFVLSIINSILTRVPIQDKELIKLQKENLQLNNDEKRLQIEKLKNEMKQLPESSMQQEDIIIQNAIFYFGIDIKILKHISNIYEALLKYAKIEKIGTRIYDNTLPLGEEKTVNRSDFPRFIMKTNDLPDMIVEEVIIEIISPVIKNLNKFKWKGFYNGNIIDFSMNDSVFKQRVQKGEIHFKGDYFIKCILHIKQVVDDNGIVQVKGYNVETVSGEYDGKQFKETEQGKRYFAAKKALKGQGDLFNHPFENDTRDIAPQFPTAL